MDKLHIFYEAINNHYLLSELDGADLLQEYNEIETNKVKQLIDTNSNWIVNDYPRFFNALKKTTRHEFFTPHTVQEFKDLGVTTYLLNGYNIGYALMPEPDGNVSIISIFNNEKEVKGVVDNILQSAIKNGGTQLDHYGVDALNQAYERNGFEEYDRYKWDDRYASPMWDYKKYGRPDVVLRRYNKAKSNNTALTEFYDLLRRMDK